MDILSPMQVSTEMKIEGPLSLWDDMIFGQQLMCELDAIYRKDTDRGRQLMQII